jgi:type I restriction enzyme S subunit
MSNKGENKLVPKLRFPEFIKDNAWEQTTIGEVGKFYYGKSAPKWSLSNDAPTPCVRYGELYTKFDTIITKIYSRTNIDPTNLRFSKGGEILVPRVGEVPQDFAKHCCYLPFEKIAIGEMISVYETNEYPIFYTHYFRTLWKEFAEVVEGQNVKNLYYVNLEPIVVGKPSFNEQKKIAEFLSSLDDIIIPESQKVELLQEYKRGLLQNLLPQEGETSPKIRFRQFEENGDWFETTLTQVADYENGKAHEQDIEDSGDYIVVNSKFISSDSEVKKFTNTAFCPAQKGDILMVLSDVPNGKAIAKCFLVQENNRYSVNQRICRITPRNVNSKILYYLLNRKPYFLAFDDGVKQTNLRKEDVLNCPLFIPSDLNEQEEIADTLSSIDDLINAQKQKVEALKLHKKGLLQGLFPSINNEE